VAINPQTLFDEAKCYLCFEISEDEALELALLARIASGAGPAPTWPFGNDGALLIDGETVNVGPSVKDYSSVTIKNGGVLLITDPTSQWMIIGCKGNFTIDATSSIIYNGIDGHLIGSPITAVAPDGTMVSYTPDKVPQGGAGGDDPQNPVSLGGTPSQGNGGGGAAFDHSTGGPGGPGGNANLNAGGTGNNGDTPNGSVPFPGGGAGATVLGATGSAGAFDPAGNPDGSYAPGGGGGFRGFYGGLIYIKLGPTAVLSLVNAQSFVLNGGTGGDGGVGGDSLDAPLSFAGSGGGGGAGGCGGKIVARYRLGPAIAAFPGFVNVTAGVNGVGGGGGNANGGGTNVNGNSGQDGTPGNDGQIDAQLY
jgi:hypothetical protein